MFLSTVVLLEGAVRDEGVHGDAEVALAQVVAGATGRRYCGKVTSLRPAPVMSE